TQVSSQTGSPSETSPVTTQLSSVAESSAETQPINTPVSLKSEFSSSTRTKMTQVSLVTESSEVSTPTAARVSSITENSPEPSPTTTHTSLSQSSSQSHPIVTQVSSQTEFASETSSGSSQLSSVTNYSSQSHPTMTRGSSKTAMATQVPSTPESSSEMQTPSTLLSSVTETSFQTDLASTNVSAGTTSSSETGTLPSHVSSVSEASSEQHQTTILPFITENSAHTMPHSVQISLITETSSVANRMTTQVASNSASSSENLPTHSQISSVPQTVSAPHDVSIQESTSHTTAIPIQPTVTSAGVYVKSTQVASITATKISSSVSSSRSFSSGFTSKQLPIVTEQFSPSAFQSTITSEATFPSQQPSTAVTSTSSNVTANMATSHSSTSPFDSTIGSQKPSSMPISVFPAHRTSPSQSHLMTTPKEGSSLAQSTSHSVSVPQRSTSSKPKESTQSQPDRSSTKPLISSTTLKKKRSTTLYPSVETTSAQIHPVSSANSTLPITSHPMPTNSTLSPTMDYCSKCTCLNGGMCNSSATTEDHCVCHCPPFTFGEHCQNGDNNTHALLSPNTPQREVSLSFWINKTWDKMLENTTSAAYKNLTGSLTSLLTPLYKKASPRHFHKVVINELREGSIVANSSGLYNYSNNQAEINYLNNDLTTTLLSIVNTSERLKNLTESVGNTVTLTRVYAPVPPIKNITELNITCALSFDKYRANCSNGNHCICEGPCKRNLGICSHNGQCFNQAGGSVCECYPQTFYQYTGTYCETFIRNSRFYGVLFGVLAAGLLLLIVIIIAIIFCCRRKRSWRTDHRDSVKWYSIDEEYFRFPQTDLTAVTPTLNAGKPLGRRRGKYSLDEHLTFEDDFGPGVWRPNLDKVDTGAEIRAKRPELVVPSPNEQ
ncbi:hypothetical protein scyTo_0020580, partial [Scyliorhinus torazame]|nr:hypothetical protein [Scyliorhinus torazame]